jgi:SPP1 gp7 family putative phage head morphogenesis protein
MGVANKELRDRIVAHLVDTRFFEEEADIYLARGISRHKERLVKLLAQDLKADIKPEVRRAVAELHSIGRNAVEDYVGAEADFQSNNLARTVGSFYDVKRPSKADLTKRVLSAPVQNASNFLKAFEAIGENEILRVQDVIKRGLLNGTAKKQLLEDVIKTTGITQTQAETLLRTTITQTQVLVTDEVVEQNRKIIKGYEFTAVLDNRTSSLCGRLDGKVFPLDDKRYLPPLHWNCRSSLIPVLKSKKELLEEGYDGEVDLEELEQLDPEYLDGEPPIRETYEQWLLNQPIETKLRLLGSEEAVALFEAGSAPLSSFVTPRGKAFSIGVLRKLDNFRTILFPVFSRPNLPEVSVSVTKPYDLIRSSAAQEQLRLLLINDSLDTRQSLSLIDYRGTTLAGKRSVRERANNVFDERNVSFDPFTGEARSTLYYDPDFQVYQERLDFLEASKLLTSEQKAFIKQFSESLEEQLSVNQQTAVVESLRVTFERYNKKKEPWDNFANVLRAENNYAVTNVSRILDRRSRARSNLFGSYSSDPDVAQVQIAGRWRTFDDLSEDLLKNQNYIDNWRKNYGEALAAKLILTGRVPLRTILFEPFKKPENWSKKLDNFLKKNNTIYKWIREINNSKDLRFWEPSRWIQDGKEQIRKILDYEVDILTSAEEYAKNLLDQPLKYGAQGLVTNPKAINLITNVIKTVADGKTTDYDALAINIGKYFHKNWYPEYFPGLRKPTLEELHSDGSRLLEAFRANGLLKVQSRGVTRRSVIDLDTGRPSGAFKDTVSREVIILDPEMLKLQTAIREVNIAQRIGIVRDRDRLYVRPGAKVYFDARGKKTGKSIITQSAAADFDEDQIDRDFANMLNHTMNVKYEVDSDFADFMDNLVRFRDPRGETKKYDELNSFRHLILERGDEGFGMMQTIKWHRQRGKPFSVLARIDARGRVYYEGYLTPTGGEVARPFLNSSKALPMNASSLKELKIQIGASLGPATEALTTDGRLAIFERNKKALIELGETILSPTQRDRRLRFFLEHPIVRSLDGEEVPKLARMALELARLNRHSGGNIDDLEKVKTFKTKLMMENDASASGAQIIALATRDRTLALASNVLPTTKKNRLYDTIAMDTMADPAFHSLEAFKDLGLTWEELAKGAKQANMVAFYGAGATGQASAVEAKLASVLSKKGIQVITRPEVLAFNKELDKAIKLAKKLDAENTVQDLSTLKKEVGKILSNREVDIADRILQYAEEVHPKSADFIRRLTNQRSGLVTAKDFRALASIMSKHLESRAPITGEYMKFWKEAADRFVRETGKVDLPFRTFDRKKLTLKFRPKEQFEVRFRDPQSGRYVRNIYQSTETDGKLKGKVSIGWARTGFGVSMNHGNDATIVRQFHLWGRENSIDTATIHDAFFTHITQAEKSKEALRKIYAEALNGDVVKETLKEFRRSGLSYDSYQELLNRAVERGLVDNPDGIRKEEVLRPLRPGEDLYGIGP